MSVRGAAPAAMAPCQRGAVLVVALVLLLVLTLLGVSGMRTATLERTIANNAQLQQDAFEAAENGIELAIAERAFTDPGRVVTMVLDRGNEVQVLTAFEGATEPPDHPTEPPAGDADTLPMQALHFRISAFGRAPRGAAAVHHQGLYVLAPEGAEPADLGGASLEGRVVRTYWSQQRADEP